MATPKPVKDNKPIAMMVFRAFIGALLPFRSPLTVSAPHDGELSTNCQYSVKNRSRDRGRSERRGKKEKDIKQAVIQRLLDLLR
jgi:hypothetical protein